MLCLIVYYICLYLIYNANKKVTNNMSPFSYLGVSMSTVKRRKEEYGLLSQRERSYIPDSELGILLTEIMAINSAYGLMMIQGDLRSRGISVMRTRIREGLIRIDPAKAMMQQRKSITRRSYCVAAPNSLWHLDANLKLAK